VANTTGSVTKIHDSAIPVVTLGPVAVGGITSTSQPWGITTDSANHVWVNNFGNNTVTELDTNGNAFSPSGGFTAGGLIKFPRNGIAVDRSGNVWVLDDDNPPAFVTELLGAASPVATPRVSGRPVAP
jgi:DNA-binding beta-propeller fold protein YncE